jgi:hypothetical protein
MDKTFISRATRITSFNFTAGDFTSLKYKKEIQYLFNLHFFPKFNLNKTTSSFNLTTVNTLINGLKSEDKDMFEKLHNYNLKGIGPGEVTLYFLIDTAHLGGGSSAGVDVKIGSKGYEVKAVKVSKDKMASDFKLGGTVPLTDIIEDLFKLNTKLKLAGKKTEMSGGIMDTMREKAPAEFKSIENRFKDIAYNSYFKNHEVIFINNGSGPNFGNIEAVKKISKNEIFIERVTSGTVKPKVKL